MIALGVNFPNIYGVHTVESLEIVFFYLFPTQKQNTTWTHFSVGYTDIKDATTVPAFVSSINTFYAY